MPVKPVKPVVPMAPPAPVMTPVSIPSVVKPVAAPLPMPAMAPPVVTLPPAQAAPELDFLAELAVYFAELAAEASSPDREVSLLAKDEIAEVLALPDVAPLVAAPVAPAGVPADVWSSFRAAVEQAQSAQPSVPIGFETPALDVDLQPPPASAPASPSNGEAPAVPPTVTEPSVVERAVAYARANPVTVGMGAALGAVGIWQGVKYYRSRRG